MAASLTGSTKTGSSRRAGGPFARYSPTVPALPAKDEYRTGPGEDQLKALGRKVFKPQGTFHGKGCSICGHTGFHGRTTVYELLEVAGPVRDGIVKRVSDGELTELARHNGMISLYECGMAKVAAGETSVDEVIKATSSL